ncbi:MAG: bifunctional folylpolyglutamate synthase/dihydrofolate synthase [Lachnospiraceae bacterium]|nr:bifunctional folylpolyglutamate synthase/dihydrofolate synthase [Lachnospiraceae bacterium]
MTYEEICDYIYKIPKFTKKNDLSHTKELLRRLEIRTYAFEIIHVAGSNGKGSVCAFLQQALTEGGCSVGMFTSPHLVCMEERFVINGQMCSREDFEESFHAVRAVVEDMEGDGLAHPAFFEYLFAMGMYLFQKHRVYFLILETGLGGRLDATNVFEEPLCTVITSISLEHTQILGDTVEKIAWEKAGIIKAGVPVVFDGSNPAAAHVIRGCARRMGAPFYEISLESIKFLRCTGKNIDFCLRTGYDVVTLTIPFAAEYQMMNAALAYRVLELLQCDTGIGREQIIQYLPHTRWAGRMQQIAPGVYLDGAHNADGIAQFVRSAAKIGGDSPLLLFGMMQEKDCAGAVRCLCEGVDWDGVIVTGIRDERSAAPEELAELFAANGQRVKVIGDSGEAYRYAMESRKEQQVVFCAGSLYLIGELQTIAGGISHD